MGRSGSSTGSLLGLVAMAVVSVGFILISYHHHRRLMADIKAKISEGADQDRRRHQPRRPKKVKKVRFADDVVEPSSNSEEYRRRVWSSSAISSTVGVAGGWDEDKARSLSLGPPPRRGDAALALPRRRAIRLPEQDASQRLA
ncbi:hypothetical protein BAE44_0018928 [Dichanthelium oligosanthes]|uniref:Uncharacterized protein n=1 Tax=Dichanthelium oligosanthes TaxID=888268 RepID=A0A1E5V4G8_9POAL|nr:hypothetical protein BAE44_0018928 [Dichanthelium oligosanthes]